MRKTFFGLFVASAALVSCNNDDSSSSNQNTTKADVIENYANLVYLNYYEALEDATELKTAINALTDAPTAEAFEEAKLKWKEARESYMATQAFHFAGSPATETALATQINAWPLDENYIDYVETDANAGIINNTEAYATLSKDLIVSLNKVGGEKNISVGYHAIEFLLWGQDLTAPADNLPGQRPYTDFVDGEEGTALNQDRRRQYLSICAEVLTDNLSTLVATWATGGAYRATFLALDENTAVTNIYLGINSAATKLTAQLDAAVASQSQEDEESDFSDNTNRDNARTYESILNVYRGQYGNVAGGSLQALIYYKSTDLYSDTETIIDDTTEALGLIVNPFDYAISAAASAEERAVVSAAADAVETLRAQLVSDAAQIGITVQ